MWVKKVCIALIAAMVFLRLPVQSTDSTRPWRSQYDPEIPLHDEAMQFIAGLMETTLLATVRVESPCDRMGEGIPYVIENNTGEHVVCVTNPMLQKLNMQGLWEDVPFYEGMFLCGTTGGLPPEGISSRISYEWLAVNPPAPGTYRIYFYRDLFKPEYKFVSNEFVIE